MAIINLHKYYYPIYPKDTLIEVPDEVAATLEEGWRIEHRQDNKKTYYHVYSMDSMTIMISSHILSEVDQMATVVGIINHGDLIFQERMSVLAAQREPHIILRTSDNNRACQMLRNMNPLITGNGLQLGALTDEQTGAVVQRLCANKIAVYRVEEHRESLETIFLNLTGKELTL